ncbi:cytochrome P450 [Actinomadura hibisca]|uniref:cytochrome P450 n=1 Tax=Actinomadura hibisca TaxID=68565 RepID=UPI000829E3BD|nr:cytochrome P450 [Actinomadura hibisca]
MSTTDERAETASTDHLAEYDAAAETDPAVAMMLALGWLRSDWRAFTAALRAHRPILVTPAFTLVTRYADVTEVLSLERVFTVADYARRLDPALGGPCVLTQDGTALKWRERGLMQVMLAPEDVPHVRTLVGRAADEALDRAQPLGRIDAVQDVFRHVALRVCADHFGFPGPDPQTMSRWSRAVMTHVTANPLDDPAVRADALQAGGEMMAYLRELLARRRGRGDLDGDVVARLLHTRLPPGVALDDERLAINVAGLLLGFVENASGSLVNLVEQMLTRPGLQAEAAAAASGAPERFDPYVWEALRFNPFLKAIARRAGRDHVIAAGTSRETPVPAGTLVLAVVASAMFDQAAVPEPDRFRLDRPRHAYLHFGHGHHDCVGGDVGAVVLAETARRLLARPGLRPLPPPEGTVVRDRDVFPDHWTLRLDGTGAEED